MTDPAAPDCLLPPYLNKKLNGYTVASIRQWWETMGHTTDPVATRLLITADGGGNNGSRNHRWTWERQLRITRSVFSCHP